jgi:glycosyltransferase involved in cell wall biosynthesis
LDRRHLSIHQDLATARVLTAPSHTCAESIRRHLPWTSELAQIEVIPHGLLRDVRRRPDELPARPFAVGTFGNLVADKGVEDVVRAAEGLPGVEVHLWGAFLEPGFENSLTSLAQDLNVELVCHGPFDETMAHPAESLHIALFPSRCEETYGLVVDEALAHGVPVLVSERGAFAERRGQGGVEVVAGGAVAFRGVLRGLVENPGSYAALRAAVPEELPSMASTAQQYRQLYRRAQENR